MGAGSSLSTAEPSREPRIQPVNWCIYWPGCATTAGPVLAQVAVGAKTNEIPVLATLLGTLDITDAVITADAMHCQRETAQIVRDREA